MGRRATAQRTTDDKAFPIRIKLKVPGDDLSLELGRVLSWLNDQIGAGGFGYHTGGALGCNAFAFYFRSMEDAWRFLCAFPELELADAVDAQAQNHPAL